MKRLLVLAFLVFALLLTACAPTPAPPTPAPPPAPTLSALLLDVAPSPAPPTAAPPSPTAVPTDTPVPTETRPPTLTPTLTPLPTATLTPTPASETSVVFTDTFGSPCGLSVVDDANRKVGCEAGEYTMLAKVANKSYSASYRDARVDGVIEVDAHMISGNEATEYGILFRSASDGSGAYFFSLTPNGKYGLSLYKDPNWTDLVPFTDSPAIKQGTEKNHIKIVAQGDQFSFYVNDQFLDTVSDKTWSTGRIGFLVGSRDANSKFGFANLTISKINRPLTLPAGKDRPPAPTPMPALAPGTGGLVVFNWLGAELNYTIGGKRYKVPPNGQVIIVLPPGHYTYSLDAPGLKASCETAQGCSIDIQEGQYIPQSWGIRQ